MTFPTIRFEDELKGGLNFFAQDFTPAIFLGNDSYNMTTGINKGYGPRYGFSSIPGHSVIDGFTAGFSAGLQASEAALQAFINRVGFLGLIQIGLGTYNAPATIKSHFAWILVYSSGGSYYIDVALSSDGSGSYFVLLPDYSYGFPPHSATMITPPAVTSQPELCHFYLSATAPTTYLQNALKLDSQLKNVAFASYSAPQRRIPMKWFFGKKITAGDATKSATCNCVNYIDSGTKNAYSGVPSDINTRKYVVKDRNVVIYNLDFTVGLGKRYDYILPNASLGTIFLPTLDQDTTIETITPGATGMSAMTGRLDAAAVAYADIDAVVVNDPEMVTNTEFSAILLANKKPLACIFQSWNRNKNGTLNQWVDLSNQAYYNPSITTTNEAGTAYTEDGIVKKTCWRCWPNFSSVTPIATEAASNLDHIIHVRAGAADSGLLRAKTIYEFTYSIFDKQFGYETNVGEPAKFLTGNDDYVSLTIWRDEHNPTNDHTAATRLQRVAIMYSGSPYTPVFIPDYLPLNYIEYRFYYRELGSYEWIPAGSVDAAEYFFNPDIGGDGKFRLCQGTIAALPGGQPSGYIDRTAIPKDSYNCVGQFRGRVFWSSEKSLVWSSKDSLFEYPLRNSVSCPVGQFKGFITHTFPGQSEQRGRIVVFGTNSTYVGYFSGNETEMPVQISADTVGQYPVEGSDFTLDDWTSSTAFSYRSAIVAEGVLYFWGPQGIFRDNGVDTPEKISRRLSPDIDTFYDPNKIDDIHTTFNAKTREIIWFYAPRDTSVTTSYGLAYNIDTEEFGFHRFTNQIDSTLSVNLSSDTEVRKTSGLRTVASIRQDNKTTLQRGYFFDERNRSGDMGPQTDFIVKTIASPTTTTRRLTLDSGYNAFNFGTIAVGDYLLIQQGADYTSDSAVLDILVKVTAKGAGTLDVLLPTSVTTFKNALSCAYSRAFPVWISRHNSIAYNFTTKYWSPAGMKQWLFWQWAHLLFKLKMISTSLETYLNFSYRTPISKQLVSNTMLLRDNSDGNMQEYSPLKFTDEAGEGQGIKFLLSGNYLGHEWVLQYFGMDASKVDGDQLQVFEG